jgi:hypothetical protein
MLCDSGTESDDDELEMLDSRKSIPIPNPSKNDPIFLEFY